MNFADSLFEDFASDKKQKEKQRPYSVKRQDFRWFLSDNNNTDNLKVIQQLKYKADYLYAQSEYTEAKKCYQLLLPLIPSSNTVLTQEVLESNVICLAKISDTEEAEKTLREMIETDKMSTSLWHLMFTIQRDKENFEEAVFAIQQCLEANEEIASYWIDLAETYGRQSTCFEWPNDFKKQEQFVDFENLDQVERTNCETQDAVVCIEKESQSFTKEENKLDTQKNKHTKNNLTKNCDLPVLHTGILNCSITDSNETELDTAVCDASSCTNVESDNEEFRTYVKHHHYCYCSLCFLMISRFLLRKYSGCLPFTNHGKKQGDILEINVMIKNITCATNKIIDVTRKLLKVKFADKMKLSHFTDIISLENN